MMPSKIAFTDLEMTGLNPTEHEIIEIGLIVADATTLQELDRFETRVHPQHLETANYQSLQFTGYNEQNWANALSLKDALTEYSKRATGSVFAAWNTPYDWMFLVAAYQKERLEIPLDYHTLDIFSIAYEKMRDDEHFSIKLTKLCTSLGIPREPMPHRAINGAEQAFELYKKLREQI
ncbi:MAG: 3'-5' exonuclease [Patescibacteria group bacterium]